ncbi:unnamed protein product, partial [marine sediment metagenome]
MTERGQLAMTGSEGLKVTIGIANSLGYPVGGC